MGRPHRLRFLQGTDANWLLLSKLILLARVAVVPLVYVPGGKLYDQALQEALAVGTFTPRLVAVLDDPVVRWAHCGEYVGLVVIVVLMVFKPL